MRAHLLVLLISGVLTGVQPAMAEGARLLSPAVIEQINRRVDADAPRLTSIYKDLHQHPEIAFTEARTASLVAKELKHLGFKVTEKIAHTGVVGVLENGPGPVVWFRADMDAVAVRETTGLPYAAKAKQRLADGSEIDVMHACGHDAHITWLLGMAKTLVGMKADWSGTLVVYAQPAEENGLGAQAMVADKLWERGFPKPDYAFGAHTAPGPVGYVASAPGVRMAGTDQLDVTFKGIGGHGSTPEMTVDPVVMAAQAVLSYQTIVSRSLDPQAAGVLTVGAIEAGRDNNVIPESVTLKLNLRWFTQETRNKMLDRIKQINHGIAIAAGVDEARMPSITMKGHAGPVVNDAKLSERVNPNLKQLLGEGKVLERFPAVMGSEDFQEAFSHLGTPYVFNLIGVAPQEMFDAARKKGMAFPYSNHNPNFLVDLAAIPLGVKINAVTVMSILQRSSSSR